MQNQIHTRDLIVGLQKGLALIQLFSKEFPRLTVPQAAKMSGLTQSAARRFSLPCCTSAICKPTDAITG